MAETAINDDGDFYFRVPANEAWTLLQFTTLLYYLHETNPDNLLVRDKTDPKTPTRAQPNMGAALCSSSMTWLLGQSAATRSPG